MLSQVTLYKNVQTTAGTLALPVARNGRIRCQSTASKRRRLHSALLVVMYILHNCYLKFVSFTFAQNNIQ